MGIPAVPRSGADLSVRQGSHGQLGGSDARCLLFLDAAKACSTSPPDLVHTPADFVVRCRPCSDLWCPCPRPAAKVHVASAACPSDPCHCSQPAEQGVLGASGTLSTA